MPYAPVRPIRPVRGLAITVITLLGVNALADLFALVAAFERVSVVSALMEDPSSVEMAKAEASDSLYALGALVQMATYLITAIVFMIWLFRARSNAEAMMDVPHRRHAAWIIFGWSMPIVSFWFPRQIVDDIWTTSWLGSRGITTLSGLTLSTIRRPRLVLAWWLLWIAGMYVPNLIYRFLAPGDDLQSYLTAARTEIIFTGPVLACAVLAGMIVWKITDFQERRRQAGPLSHW
ncbi:DUF4328 domain-containing protein [Planobispora siamensis]|nr:DUF4328 domain-containing protein [Planobispora siamensis]